MRKIITLIITLLFSAASFSQQTTSIAPPLTKTDYLKKGKNQKTAAWLLLGGGATVSLIGIAVEVNSANNALIDLFTLQPTITSSSSGGVLLITGGFAMLGSIPLFIASGKNKRKANAATTFFKMETMQVIQQHSLVQHPYPAISVKIGL